MHKLNKACIQVLPLIFDSPSNLLFSIKLLTYEICGQRAYCSWHMYSISYQSVRYKDLFIFCYAVVKFSPRLGTDEFGLKLFFEVFVFLAFQASYVVFQNTYQLGVIQKDSLLDIILSFFLFVKYTVIYGIQDFVSIQQLDQINVYFGVKNDEIQYSSENLFV